mmetsp:Transcript_55235/g.99457  ORF Transcript_55235/g.99457 Transcript_55235/m.99457 type:complete len:155 (+) Transcript_55235:38-502(+)
MGPIVHKTYFTIFCGIFSCSEDWFKGTFLSDAVYCQPFLGVDPLTNAHPVFNPPEGSSRSACRDCNFQAQGEKQKQVYDGPLSVLEHPMNAPLTLERPNRQSFRRLSTPSPSTWSPCSELAGGFLACCQVPSLQIGADDAKDWTPGDDLFSRSV